MDKLFHILDLAVHMVTIFGCALFYQSTPSLFMLKSYRWGGVVAHVILVSAQVSLVLTFGLWDFRLGLDNMNS